MFDYNDVVKDVDTGEVYRVVAPVDGEEATTVVWSDLSCKAVLVYPTEQLITTDALLDEQQHAHIVYDIVGTSDNESMQVNRRVSGRGLDPVIAAYTDMRTYVSKISEMPIKEIDIIIDKPQG